MSKMVAIKDISSPVNKPKYMWNSKWVRPHESLWSAMRNFRIVNGHCSYKEALELLDIGPLTSKKNEFQPESSYAIFSRYTIKENWQNIIDSVLLPSDYHSKSAPIKRLMEYAPRLFSRKLYYCPECMKLGYHSYLHQLSEIKRCPFHPEEKLLMDYRETYIWGENERLYYDLKDQEYTRYITPFSFGFHSLNDFNIAEISKLPIQWKISGKLLEKMANIYIYDGYESLDVSSSSVPFVNTDISGGSFFIADAKRSPFVTIYDAEFCDSSTREELIKEGNDFGIDSSDLLCKIDHYYYGIVVLHNLLLLIMAKRFIGDITIDDIRRCTGYLAMGGKVKSHNSTDAKVMFLWDYIGCKYLHKFLSMNCLENLNVEDNEYALEKRYCAQNLFSPSFIRTYGITAAMHILEDHMKHCYGSFSKCLDHKLRRDPQKGVGLGDSLELLYVPTYLTEKRGKNIYIYKEV